MHDLQEQGTISHGAEIFRQLRWAVALCRGAFPEAASRFKTCYRRSLQAGSQVVADATLARSSLALGRRDEALQHSEAALAAWLALGERNSVLSPLLSWLAYILSGMEEAEDSTRRVRSAVEQVRRAYPGSRLAPTRACLEPASGGARRKLAESRSDTC